MTPATDTPTLAWIIEHRGRNFTRYVCVDHQPAGDEETPLKLLLCTFPREALRFARAQDARRVLNYLLERRGALEHPPHEYTVCAHQFAPGV